MSLLHQRLVARLLERGVFLGFDAKKGFTVGIKEALKIFLELNKKCPNNNKPLTMKV